jgi:hypothetical protein
MQKKRADARAGIKSKRQERMPEQESKAKDKSGMPEQKKIGFLIKGELKYGTGCDKQIKTLYEKFFTIYNQFRFRSLFCKD